MAQDISEILKLAMAPHRSKSSSSRRAPGHSRSERTLTPQPRRSGSARSLVG